MNKQQKLGGTSSPGFVVEEPSWELPQVSSKWFCIKKRLQFCRTLTPFSRFILRATSAGNVSTGEVHLGLLRTRDWVTQVPFC